VFSCDTERPRFGPSDPAARGGGSLPLGARPRGAANAARLTRTPRGGEHRAMTLSEPVPAPPPALAAATMCEALMTTAPERPDQVALRSPDDAFSLTFAQLARRLAGTASVLHDLGLRRGDALGLMMLNRPEFHVVDAAAMLLGATPFSLYNTSPAEQIAFVMGDAGNRLVVCEPRFAAVLREAASDDVRVVELDELTGGDEGFDLEPHWRAVTPDDLLTLIYTSGTTGAPKGVELTHAGMLAELRGVHAAVPLESGGRWVSFLPSAHVADRWGSHYSALMTYGHTVTPVADPTQVFAVVAQVRPTAFGGVPRVWEKLKAALEASGAAALPADALKARLGLDEARWLAVGAAPTPVEVLEFFAERGMPICEVWGMSETSCIVTTNRPGAIKFGSVGQPVEGMKLWIADDGELLVRGPLVMAGYRNRPDLTAEAVDADGWLHTGDVARIDEDGFVWIVDRKKELIINAAGKNMSPANIEARLKASGPLIGQACVVGDRRPFNVALLVLDPDTGAGLDPEDPEVVARVQDEVDAANAHLARVEQIKRFRLLAAEWLPGGDELTPTMKLKRRPIAAKYAGEIDALYA
jgi:long-subunit acyl-CoA synthetase (AMP-forming)